ncbi:MAG: GNAT family N-acetyltransferase [Pyrinomonadaceae bacterium]
MMHTNQLKSNRLTNTMYQSTALAVAYEQLPADWLQIQVAKLTANDEAEVLEFLSARPLHTITMVGFIRDNGLISPLNRGAFYSCRNRQGQLEGVALIGHANLMETTTDRALQAFAEIAQQTNNTHMIMGEKERIGEFWSYYSEGGQEMRLACRELLFEIKWPIKVEERTTELRLATHDDLELVMPVQAQMAFEESGINPMEKDLEGFRQRCTRRIEQGRTWVAVADGKLLFKADIISDTAAVTYLEGIWVNPEERGTGLGRRCMSQLAQTLLSGSESICLLVNEKNTAAQHFYQRAGYKLRSIYDTIFLA